MTNLLCIMSTIARQKETPEELIVNNGLTRSWHRTRTPLGLGGQLRRRQSHVDDDQRGRNLTFALASWLSPFTITARSGTGTKRWTGLQHQVHWALEEAQGLRRRYMERQRQHQHNRTTMTSTTGPAAPGASGRSGSGRGTTSSRGRCGTARRGRWPRRPGRPGLVNKRIPGRTRGFSGRGGAGPRTSLSGRERWTRSGGWRARGGEREENRGQCDGR